MKTLIFLCLSLVTLVAFSQDCVPVTVIHSPDNGSPFVQTITYNVVTGVPGEESKCWITSNLGADHPASSVNDQTARGWYWQFNRTQGYSYTTGRVPSSTWDFNIKESSNWSPTNDPCRILGTGWHVPTLREWTNVDANWYSADYAFNSPLKLSVSGYLYYRTGNLMYSNKYGMYWSSEQAIWPNYAYNYVTWAATSNTSIYNKSMGQSIRCVK